MSGQVATEREITGSVALPGAPAFVGRELELAALAQALASGPAVVLIEGEGGIGKSRLVAEFLATLAGQRSRVLVACCPPLRTPCTLGPVVDALRQRTGSVPDLASDGLAGVLRPLFPEWADLLPPAPEPVLDATAARHQLFRALAEMLDRLRVTVLVAEDVHWADETTLEFLLFLASRQPRQASLVITCRPEDVPLGSLWPRLARLAAGSSGLRLALGPLDLAQTSRLVSSMLQGEPLSAEFAAFLHQRTDGIPLALEESVRLLHQRADLARRNHGWVRRHLAEIDVPPTVRDAVLERAMRLSPDARLVLRAAAVLAAPAGEVVLAAVAGLPVARVRAGLCEVLDCGLLTENTSKGRGLVSFRHVLPEQAICEAIPAPERRVLHRRAGRALESASPPPLGRLTRHFREAGDTAQWCRYAEQAADLALGAGDDATADAVLHGLVTEAGLPAGEMARLTHKIMLLAFPGDAQLRDLAYALRAALDTGDLTQDEAASLRFQLGRVLIGMEEDDAGRAELERAVRHLPRGSLQAVRAMTLLGWPTGSTCRASEHLRWLRRAAASAGSLEPSERVRLHVDRATALLMLGEQEGWAEAGQMASGAPAPRERLHVTRGCGNVGEAAMVWGRYAEARQLLTRAAELASSYGYARMSASAASTLAHLDWLTGSWDGLAGGVASLAADEDMPPETKREAVLVSALLDAAAGAGEQAGESLLAILEEARRRGALQYMMEPAAALARLRVAAGDPGEALQITAEPMGIVAAKGVWLWATDLAPARIAALAAVGRMEEAAGLVATFARGLRGREAPAPQAALVACRAILAEARGEHTRAAALFARAAGAWEALPRPHDALLARERQACCLLAAGRPDPGLAVMSEAQRGLAGLGAVVDADRVARVLRGRGIAVSWVRPSRRRGYGDRLSPRELEVVRLVIAGHTNREIAGVLCRSPDTVATQLKSAMRKMRVSSRAALAATATAAGVTTGDDRRRQGQQPPAAS